MKTANFLRENLSRGFKYLMGKGFDYDDARAALERLGAETEEGIAMRYVLTNAEMRAADEFTMESGVSSLTLMERAGKAVAKLAEKALSYLSEKSVAVVCGCGNNGGDGYCAARILAKKGVSVVVFEAFPPKTVECQLENARCRTPRINTLKKGYGLVIDCLYGTGFHGTLNEPGGADRQRDQRKRRVRAGGGYPERACGRQRPTCGRGGARRYDGGHRRV